MLATLLTIVLVQMVLVFHATESYTSNVEMLPYLHEKIISNKKLVEGFANCH